MYYPLSFFHLFQQLKSSVCIIRHRWLFWQTHELRRSSTGEALDLWVQHMVMRIEAQKVNLRMIWSFRCISQSINILGLQRAIIFRKMLLVISQRHKCHLQIILAISPKPRNIQFAIIYDQRTSAFSHLRSWKQKQRFLLEKKKVADEAPDSFFSTSYQDLILTVPTWMGTVSKSKCYFAIIIYRWVKSTVHLFTVGLSCCHIKLQLTV